VSKTALQNGLVTHLETGMADGPRGDAISLLPDSIFTSGQVDKLVTKLPTTLTQVEQGVYNEKY
jgi:adenosylmethionine-8-amino-7-oxononanoate aminotransferase